LYAAGVFFVKIVRTHRYLKDLKKLKASEADMEAMERMIATDPAAGVLIQGLRGVRKARFRIGNRGKSSGGRAIYYVMLAEGAVLKITAYAKAEKTDLSAEDRRVIAGHVEELKR
jgi:hypothetical protein